MNISRNASDYDYDTLGHAGERKRERQIPIEAVDQAIEDGEAKEGKEDRINFEAKWSGATYTVVANPKTGYIVTTFWGTSNTGKSLEEAQKRKEKRKEKINERRGAAYTGAWQ